MFSLEFFGGKIECRLGRLQPDAGLQARGSAEIVRLLCAVRVGLEG